MKPGRSGGPPARQTAAGGKKPAAKRAEPLSRAAQQELVALFNAGRHAELENRAGQLLEQHPGSGFAWKVLGAVLLIQKKDALVTLQKAAGLLPDDAETQNNLGVAFFSAGRLNEAVASYRRALAIRPDYAEAHNNLGSVQRSLGQLDAAVASLRRALEIKPGFADALANLGNALKDQGQPDEAVKSLRRALELKPNSAKAHGGLGSALKLTGQVDAAIECYRRALELDPDFVEAHHNLGIALYELGQPAAAAASFSRALELRPDYANAHANLGNALGDLGRFDEAISTFRRALEIRPDHAEAHNNLGNILKDLGQLDAAVASYRRALELKPENFEIHSNLLFALSFQADQTVESRLAAARRYGNQVAQHARPYVEWNTVPDPARCLRVGWVSGDLRTHPVGHFVVGVLSTLASVAAGRLEFFGYPTHPRSDELTDRIRACCTGWHSALGLSDERLARRIHDDGIDILIDLTGHTAGNRLPMFAWKPAPVQATWLGYLGTTGVAAIDYLIADALTLPQSDSVNYSESICYLPESYVCFTPPAGDMPVSPLPASFNEQVTFGSFNNLTKMNDAVVELWARVLGAVPNSRLLLKAKQLREESVRQSVADRFARHGVAAGRLILKPQAPRSQYLAPYAEVDIALDPFPYPGITTTVESLWMGVPVLTLAGTHFQSRQGVGLLTNAGLADWIAADADDFVARALRHAADRQSLAALRMGLRQTLLASPIFDAARFGAHFETALRGMWVKWCDSQNGGKAAANP
jgi:predicted O-linked N-acetylglucosamine transferase (SPINDLY family)